MNHSKVLRPEKIIQFGEGGFLRGFVDWIVQITNENSDFNGSVAVVQPIAQGMCDLLQSQDCVYTHVMRGLKDGVPTVDKKIIDCISRTVKPYDNYDEYLKLADNPDFKIIVSNTTESGIAYREGEAFLFLQRLQPFYTEDLKTVWTDFCSCPASLLIKTVKL